MNNHPPTQPRRRSSARRTAVLLATLLSIGSLAGAPATTSAYAAAAQPAAATVVASTTTPHHLSAEVVGYLPHWEMDATTFADLDLTKLTSIVLFSIGWDGSGHLITDAAGYRAITSPATTSFVSAARAAGVRVLVSFTSFGVAKNAAFFGDAAAQATLVREAAAFVAAHGLDGADLDVELISGTYFGAYAATAGALRSTIRSRVPGGTVTVATNGNISGAKMAAQAIAAGADRAFLMGYSYRSAGSTPGSIDPLARAGGALSLTTSLDLYRQYAVPLDRVILGLPLYGRTWPTVDATAGSARRTDLGGTIFLLQDLAALRASGTVTTEDDVAVELSHRVVRTIDGVTWQSFYDAPVHLEAKMRLVLERHLAGAGLWALGYSTGHPEYWAAIGHVFGAPTVTSLSVVPAPTRLRTVAVRVTWRDGAAPVTEMRIANGRTAPFGAWRPIAATTWTLPSGRTVVTRTVRVQLRDAAGAESVVASTRILYDHSRPNLTKLTVAWSSTARAWTVRYAGSDTGSGLASYRIVLKRNGVYKTLAVARITRSYRLRLPRSAHFTIIVRARDRARNVSLPLSRYR